jgi:hypothetical protein
MSSSNDGYPGPATSPDRMPKLPDGPGSGMEDLPRLPSGPALPTGGPHQVGTEQGVFDPAPYPPLQRVAEAILLWAGDKLYDQLQFHGAGLIVSGLCKHVSPNLVSARQVAGAPFAVEVAALRWAAEALRGEHQDDTAGLVEQWAAGFEALP